MFTINSVNGADKICLDYCKRLMDEVKTPLIGVELGAAYCGGVESIGKLWGDRGQVWAYDTFEDKHPRHLAVSEGDFEAWCMDYWYAEPKYGTDNLKYDYIRGELDRQGLSNVHLVRGLVTPDSCADLPYINYALLDMDMIASMRTGWEAVKGKIAPGGYVFFHDVLPKGHLPKLYNWFYNDILVNQKEGWALEGEWRPSYLAALKKL